MDDIVMFNNIQDLRYGQTIQSNGVLGVVMGIMEKQSIGLMFKRCQEGGLIEPGSELYLQGNSDYDLSKVTQEQNESSPLTFNTPKRFTVHRSNNHKQLYTGNIYIDCFQPITNGQLIKLSESKLLNKLSGFDKIVVSSQRNLKLQHQDITKFSGQDSLSSNYMLPRFALDYAFEQSKKCKTLLVVDSLMEHLRAYQVVQEATMKQIHKQNWKRVYVSDYLGKLADAAGYRASYSDLTVAVVVNTQDEDDPIMVEASRELDSLVSLNISSNEIRIPSVMSKQVQTPLMYYLSQQLYQVLNNYEQLKKEYKTKQQLKIHVDPWDFYGYFDCKTLVKLITLFNNGNYSQVDMIVLIYWITRVVQDETASLLKGDAAYILKDLLEFSQELKEFDKLSFQEHYNQMKEQLGNEEFKQFILESLGRFYELHILHLRMNDQLLPYKRDYINEQ